jgi:hypothetical protein
VKKKFTSMPTLRVWFTLICMVEYIVVALLAELTAWLTEAGFGDIRVYGDARLRRPREDEQRVYVCCVRK